MKKRFKQHELSERVFIFDDGYRGKCPHEDSDLIAFKWWMDYRFPDVLYFKVQLTKDGDGILYRYWINRCNVS